MAHPNHVEAVRSGWKEFQRWQETSQGPIDLSEANLVGVDLSGFELKNCNFQRADLRNAKLCNADLSGSRMDNANLAGADLTNARMTRCEMGEVNLSGATLVKVWFDKAIVIPSKSTQPLHFVGCELGSASLRGREFRGARFDDCNLIGVVGESLDLTECSMRSVICIGAKLDNVPFVEASLHNVDFSHSWLDRCSFFGANIEGSIFTEARISNSNFRKVRNAQLAKGLEATLFEAGEEPKWFETANRPFLERYCDWEAIRTVGRMQLFGVSYFLLVYLVTSFYLIGQFNDKINAAKAWVEVVEEQGNVASRGLAERVDKHLKPFKIGLSSVAMLIATLLLVGASMIYALACPQIVKDFSRAEWCYAYQRSLIHYWPLSWSRRKWRITCAALYALGGAIFLPISLWKIGVALDYAWQFIEWPWFT